MEKLDKYIKECNLVFTDTIDIQDFCRVDFNMNETEVNYQDSISLFHLVTSFNNLYQSFKKEFDKMEKLNLGQTVEVLNFGKFEDNGNCYRNLILYIDNPTMTNHKETYLYLREINGEIKPFITNSVNPFVKDEYRENIKLNDEVSKKYLDLFEKYELLLKIYNHLKNSQLFGDGTNSIYTVIDNYNSNLLEGLKTFKISFCSTYFNTEYYAEFLINLGDNFGLDYDNCKLIIDCENIKADEKIYKKVLNDVYVNKKYTEK